MKSITSKLTIVLLLLIAGAVHAQDFAKVDNIVKSYPASFANTDKFAEQVAKDFKRDDEKARAIFTWIATRVKYDLAAFGVNERPVAFSYKTEAEKLAKQKKFKEDIAASTLKTKKGVCQGYATLFESVAEKVGLDAEIIPGSSKSHPAHIGKLPTDADHAWNAVKIDGQWKLVDATWGAGTVTGNPEAFQFRFNDKYFFSDPEVFFLNHYPEDEKWLLTKASKKEFAELPLYYGSYLMGGYEFLSPGTGIFSSAKPQMLPFKIKNLKPTDRIAYAYSKDKYYNEVKPSLNGNIAEFQVPLSNTSTGVLTIYINEKSIASYRINRS